MFKSNPAVDDYQPNTREFELQLLIAAGLNRHEALCIHSRVYHMAAFSHADQPADLIQVACTAILVYKDRYDPSTGYQFLTYIYKCALGAVSNYIKRENRYLYPRDPNSSVGNHDLPVRQPIASIEAAVGSGSENLDFHRIEQAQTSLLVHTFLQSLTPRQQHIARSVYLEHRTQRDVADELGISTALVQRELTRVKYEGRRFLSAHLD